MTLVVEYALGPDGLTPEDARDAVEEVIQKAKELGDISVASIVWPDLPEREETVVRKVPARASFFESLL